MIIKTQKKNLLDGTQIVEGAISVKNTLPILSNLLLQTKQNNIELVATDLDMGINTEVDCDVVETGAITIPAKKFLEIVRELPDGVITITSKKNNTVHIECKQAYFNIVGIPKEEFPKLPEIKQETKIKIPTNTLKQMVLRTAFAASTDETRHILNGVHFTITGNAIKLVATDGRRLAVSENSIDTQQTQAKVVVPTKTINELSRLIKDEEKDVEMVFEQNQAMFKLGKTTIISRLIEGQFPDYEQAVPKEPKEKAVVDKDSFLLAVKRASLLSTPESRAVKLDILKDRIIVSKHTPNLGETKEEVKCKYAGEEHSMGFNPTYLIEGLRNVEQEKLSLEFTGADKPATTRTEQGYIYVVLPMQIT